MENKGVSTRFPDKVIDKIIEHALPLPGKPYIGHTRYTAIRPWTCSKKVYSKAKHRLRTNGSWTLPISLDRQPFQVRLPPAWIRGHVLKLNVVIFTPDFAFPLQDRHAFRQQLLALKGACPRLEDIIFTFRTIVETDEIDILGRLALERPQFRKMTYLIESCLPPRVVHRGVRMSFEVDNEPTSYKLINESLNQRWQDVVLQRDVVFYLQVPTLGWVDSRGALLANDQDDN